MANFHHETDDDDDDDTIELSVQERGDCGGGDADAVSFKKGED